MQRSRRLVAVVAAGHGAAALAVLPLALPPLLKVSMVAALAVAAWCTASRLFGRRRIDGLTLHADGRLEFARRDGSRGEALIDSRSTVSPLLTVLLLKIGGHREALVLLGDCLAQNDFRLLRLWLRWRLPAKPS